MRSRRGIECPLLDIEKSASSSSSTTGLQGPFKLVVGVVDLSIESSLVVTLKLQVKLIIQSKFSTQGSSSLVGENVLKLNVPCA